MFFFPNRPTLIPPDPVSPTNPSPDYITRLEQTGKYIGEYKWNGDNTEIKTDDMSFWNRDGTRLSYQPTPEIIEELSRFPEGCTLNAETMHRHTKNVKNLIILHSILVWKGKPLIGKSWGDARKILEDQGLPQTKGTLLSYPNHVVTAQIHKKGFWDMFQNARQTDENIEGIVLKDPKGLLVFSTTPLNDVPWMLKIRKPSKKYQF